MGAKKGKRGRRKASSDMFLQDLYSKNPIAVLGSTFALLLIVSGAMFLQANAGQKVYTDSGLSVDKGPTPVINAVYGKVTKIAGNTIEVTVAIGEARTPFSFVYDDKTTFSVFSYANDEDLVGSETAISSDELSIGDVASVYTKEAPGSVSSQHATRIIIAAQ